MIKEFLPLIKKVLWKVMKANGLIENFMVRVFLNGKMDQFMKDNIKMDKKRPWQTRLCIEKILYRKFSQSISVWTWYII